MVGEEFPLLRQASLRLGLIARPQGVDGFLAHVSHESEFEGNMVFGQPQVFHHGDVLGPVFPEHLIARLLHEDMQIAYVYRLVGGHRRRAHPQEYPRVF